MNWSEFWLFTDHIFGLLTVAVPKQHQSLLTKQTPPAPLHLPEISNTVLKRELLCKNDLKM